jgi:hypothetical protein
MTFQGLFANISLATTPPSFISPKEALFSHHPLNLHLLGQALLFPSQRLQMVQPLVSNGKQFEGVLPGIPRLSFCWVFSGEH